jgi:imidazolonepropionase-like amidohydrolase
MKRLMIAAALASAATAGIATAQPAATASAPAATITYIQAGAVLDRPGERPRGATTIIVRDGKIAELRDGFVAPEAGARLVDLRDRFVLPGLIDMHVHFYSTGEPLKARLAATGRDLEDGFVDATVAARKTLEAGFTTVRDLGGEPRGIRALRDAIARGDMAGPTIINAGEMLSVTAGHGDANGLKREYAEAERHASSAICNGPDDCRRATRDQIFMGAEVIKFAASGGVGSNIAGGLAQQMTDAEMRAIVETAHAFGRKATAHAHGKDGIDAALRAGVDSIEHGSFIDDETVALFKKSGAYLVPTMLAFESVIRQGRAGERPPASVAKAEEVATVVKQSHARAVKGGVKLAFGTVSGVGAHGINGQEFGLMTQVGVTPAMAIRAATIDAATLLGRAERIGSLAPGKDADIVAVAGNPLDDVRRLERVDFVMRRGIVHKLGDQRQAFPAQ